ncbi:MAG: Rne/Rng family ribonuclease, partial [Planctomycetota bacterium]|nr:Rne/Rng family ribonuclease [Planctomycetota bacterium]
MTSSLLLVVHARDPEESRVALVSGQEILELRWSGCNEVSMVGNLYKGIVTRLEPGLDAAFVDFGGRRAGFLHIDYVHPGYSQKELSPIEVLSLPEEEGDSEESLRIEDCLEVGQEVIVQVLRDPVRGKGATLSTSISIAGRLLVFMPGLHRSGVSRRIESEEERGRLKAILEAYSGENESVIARTAAAGCTETELQRDFQQLQNRWTEVCNNWDLVEERGLLGGELSPRIHGVRDLLLPNVSKIVVDTVEASEEIQEALLLDMPEDQRPELEIYQGSRSLFEKLDIERAYQLIFRSRVPLEGGGSIVIHETEALTAIDINSGRLDRGSLEETALAANLVAAKEVARQIRLRDLGGIVVVDFIDMRQVQNRRILESEFRAHLGEDRARLKSARLASFGLMSLTRRRLGTGPPRASEHTCFTCGGSGTIANHHMGAFRVIRRLRAMEPRKGRLRVHPGVAHVLEAEHLATFQGGGWELSLESDPQLAP